MTDLDKLIEVVELATLPEPIFHGSSSVRGHWAYNTGLDAGQRRSVFMAYNGSLDAAKALHDALLPGWNATVNFGLGYASVSSPDHKSRVTFWDGGSKWESVSGETYNAEVSDNTSRSWLLAILRAYEAQQ